MSTKPQITALDFNNIYNKIAAILGTGVGTRGYGQTIQSSSVLSGQEITRDQWNHLRNDLIAIRRHQTGNNPTIVPVVVGTPIGLSVGDAPVNYQQLSDIADAARFDLGTGQFVINAVDSKTYSSTWGGSPSTRVASSELNVVFSDNNDARYFFNSGGKFRISSLRSGGTITAQNNAWTNLLQVAGTQQFGGNIPNLINWYSLTDAYQEFYSLSASTPYSSNVYRLEAKCNVADNSTGLANELWIKISLVDGYIDPGNNPDDDPDTTGVVDGTLTITVDEVKASGLLEPDGPFIITGYDMISLSSITISSS
jgi:hypothetical protein